MPLPVLSVPATPVLAVNSAVWSTDITPANTSVQNPGWQVVVPAYSGQCKLEVVGGVFVQVTTGTNLATVTQDVFVRIVDELSNVVAYGDEQIFGTGTSQVRQFVIPCATVVANSAIDKTYHVELAYSRQGTLSASATFRFASPYPAKTLLAYRL